MAAPRLFLLRTTAVCDVAMPTWPNAGFRFTIVIALLGSNSPDSITCNDRGDDERSDRPHTAQAECEPIASSFGRI